MSELNPFCFGCGKENPDGLQLEFHFEGEIFVTEVVFYKKYEGYPGIVHGGILCSVMDELMATHLYRLGYAAMTADLQVRFKLPVPCEKKIRFESSIESLTKRLWMLSSEAKLPSGEAALSARAKMLAARFEMEGKVFDYVKNNTPQLPNNKLGV